MRNNQMTREKGQTNFRKGKKQKQRSNQRDKKKSTNTRKNRLLKLTLGKEKIEMKVELSKPKTDRISPISAQFMINEWPYMLLYDFQPEGNNK